MHDTNLTSSFQVGPWPSKNIARTTQDSKDLSFRAESLEVELKRTWESSMVLIGALSTLVLLLMISVGWLLVRMQRLEIVQQQSRDSELGLQIQALEQKLQSFEQNFVEDSR